MAGDEAGVAPPTVSVAWIGGNCPVQAEGTINGAPFYFRPRGGAWRIEIGGGYVLEDASKGIPSTGFYMEREYGDGPYDAGWMPVEEARGFIEVAAAEYAANADPIHRRDGDEVAVNQASLPSQSEVG